MTFESLANELLLEVFEYFSIIDLFRAFRYLNSRFNQLLFIHYRNYHLDFRSLTKYDFDLICQQYIPLIIDRITSICLSDDEETPQETDRFYSYNFTFHQFTNLRSISWYHLRSTDILSQLMIERNHLSYLTHLNFIQCEFAHEDKDIIDNIIKNIWSLSKLIHCHLDILFTRGYYFISPTMISPSLEYLYIMPYVCDLNQLLHLFEYTPRLRHFCTQIESDIVDERILSTISSITRLDLSVYESPYAMMHLLHNVPNLYHLTIDAMQIIINGHVWEKLIIEHLIKLKVFRLNMSFNFPNDDSKEQRIDELLNTFRTPFWLEERRWFVRCDWDRCLECDKGIYLYTLTYLNRDLSHCQSSFRSKTTCPNVNDAWSFKHVHKLTYINNPSSELVSSYLRFSSLRELEIDIPLDENFWCCIPNFDQLTSLIISYDDDDNIDSANFEQVQLLLDRAPRLNSIGFQFSSLVSMQCLPIKFTSQSIRRLDFQKIDQFFDDQQCLLLSQSSLGIQCEILSILVQNRTNIINLLNTMINLRVLNVYSQDDQNNDELIQWLKHHLPSTCIISRNKKHTYTAQSVEVKTILIWIR
jgi:hypothetical protein